MLSGQNNIGATIQPPAARGAALDSDMERVRAAAQEFEAALVNAWWQAMEGVSGEQDADGPLTGNSGVLGDFSRQTMATAIAQAGGIGLSRMIVEKLVAHGGQPAKVSEPNVDL